MLDVIKFLFDGVLGALIVSLFIWYLTTQLNSIKNKAKYLYKKHKSILYKSRKFMPHNSDYKFSIFMEESLDRDFLCDELRKREFYLILSAKDRVEFKPSQNLLDRLHRKFTRSWSVYYPIKTHFKKLWPTILLFILLIIVIIFSFYTG